MKKVHVLSLWTLAVLVLTSSAGAQSIGDFRSQAIGNWGSTSTWQTWNGSTWVNAAQTPSGASGNTITVQSSHTVTVDVVVSLSGSLTVLGTLSFSGSGTVSVSSGGILQNAGTVNSSTGTLTFSAGSTYQHNFTTTAGAIPTATWSAGSTCAILGFTSNTSVAGVAGWNQSFHHVTWNCPNQTAIVAVNASGGGTTTLTNINGNFTLINTGTGSVVEDTYPNTVVKMNIGADLILQGGTFNFGTGSSANTLNIGGNYNQTSGTFQSTGSGVLTVNFTEANGSFTQSGGTLTTSKMNFTVVSGAALMLSNNIPVASGRNLTVSGILNCGTNLITGAGAFTLSSGGTLGIGSTAGISTTAATGNIQVTGAKSFNTGANYTYNGTAAQITGNALPVTVNNLTMNNGAGVSLTASATVNGTLTLSSGLLATAANQLIIPTGGTVSGGGLLSYVTGNLQKAFSIGNGQSFTFPIGDISNYTPINLASLNVTHAGNLTASVTSADHPNISTSGLDSNLSLNRYWTLTAGGSVAASYSATFNFVSGDLDAGANTAAFAVRSYNGASWSATTTGTQSATSTQVTGNSFGDFAIGDQLMDHYSVTAASPQTAGTVFSATVSAQDLLNQPITTDNSTVVTVTGTGSAQFDSNGDGLFGDNTKTLSAGTLTINSKDIVAEGITITGSDGNGKTGTSAAITVNAGAFVKLQLLMPGETAAPGTTTGKTGTPAALTAGTPFNVIVRAVDANWNLVSVNDTVKITTTDPNATLPANAALSGGTKTFSVTIKTAGNHTVTATDFTDGTKTPNTSPATTVNVGAFAKLQVLMPGETAAPGSGTGKAGAPIGQNTDTPFNMTVNAVDANWNLISTAADTVAISSSDANAVLPPNAPLSGGTQTFSVKFSTAGNLTVTATDVSDGTKTANTSSSITVSAGAFVRLQLLMPGEAAAPGTTTGKTGSPSARTAGTAFSVTVRAVDANWNLVSTNDTVQITASDPNAALPANAALNAGTKNLNVTFKTVGTYTVTATDFTDPTRTSSTSPVTTVNVGAFKKLQILTPGETVSPGSSTGKTGSPVAQNTDAPFTVTVNAVDANWNLIAAAADTVAISSTDANAVLPANAALSGGTQTFSVKMSTAGNRKVTATDVSDGTKTANTSPSIAVAAGAFVKLQLLMPGEAAAAGTSTGKTGAPTARTAGTAFNVTVRAVDANWNLVSVNDTVTVTTTDPNATLPVNTALNAGTKTLNVTFKTAGTQLVTASDFTDATKTPSTSPATTVNVGAFTKLQVLAPGETSAPGTATGKTGTPAAQDTDTPFTVAVNAVDANWNLINAAVDLVAIGSTDTNAVLPGNAALSGGSQTFSVKMNTAGNSTVVATDVTDGTKTAGTSSSLTVNPGAFVKLQLLVPGETAAPGTATGKTGTPAAQVVGTALNLVLNAVDTSWNPISNATDIVSVTSSDANAVLPPDAALVSGTNLVSVVFQTAGNWTLTASDLANVLIVSNTSPALTVNPGDQTITFSSPGDQTYGIAPISLGAIASSGLAVSYTAAGSATTTGNLLTITGAGSVTITASQDGDANWNAATPVSWSISVAQKALIGSIIANNKIYDGTNTATIGTRTLSGVINSDLVSLIGDTAAFDDKNVGNGKTVIATGLDLSGANAGNYVLASTSATNTANITTRALIVTPTGVDKLYDGTTAATVTLSENRISGDVLTPSYTTATFADQNAGIGKTVSVSGIAVSGTDSGNYTFNATASTTANITAVALTVTANDTNRVFGAANPAFTASYSGFVNGETATVVQGAVGFSTSAMASSPVGSYAVSPDPGSLSAANYSFISFQDGTLTITKASSATAVESSANPSPTTSNVTFTATLTALSPGSGTPTGTVQFLADSAPLGSPVALAGGIASISTFLLSHGTHFIAAQYTGDGNFFGSTNNLSPDQSVNGQPIAGNVSLPRYQNGGAKVRVSTLLAGATDPDNDPVTFGSVSATSAAGGTVALSNGWVFYEPPPGFTNSDSFTYGIADSGGLQATGSVSISILVDPEQSQNIVEIEDLGENASRIHFQGIAERLYTIQYAESLVTPDWQPLGTGTADATGSFEFTDTPGNGSPTRFYRSTPP